MGLMTTFDIHSRFEAVQAVIARADAVALKATARALTAEAWTKVWTKVWATAWPLLGEIADPRGRCNRKAFLVIALAFLALQAGTAALFWLFAIEPDQTTTVLLNAPILWIGTTICLKRLHDVGLSGWWLPGAFALWLGVAILASLIVSLVLGEEALEPGRLAFYAVFAMITLPAFGALIWLHTAPSVADANRYGPIVGANGLSMPVRG